MQTEIIKAAARQLFEKLSYSKTTVADIAAAAGLGKGTVYLYFPSKDDIFRAILDDRFRQLDLANKSVFADASLSMEAKINHFLQLLVDQHVELKHLLFGSLENVEGRTLEVVFGHLNYCLKWYQAHLTEIIRDQCPNELRSNPDYLVQVGTLAMQYLELIVGRLLLHFVQFDWSDSASLKTVINEMAPKLYRSLMLELQTLSLMPDQTKANAGRLDSPAKQGETL